MQENKKSIHKIVVLLILLFTFRCNSIDRYKKIQDAILINYKRTITVLDLNAPYDGFFSFKIAEKFPSTCVMIREDDDKILINKCQDGKFSNIILMNKKISLHELQEFGLCEHFDVILALDDHLFSQDDALEKINMIVKLGDNIVIEIPYNENDKHLRLLHEHMQAMDARYLGRTLQEGSCLILYWIQRTKNSLEKTHWGRKGRVPGIESWGIESNFEEKRFIKKYTRKGITKIRPWYHGINLLTFKALNGIYPQYEQLKKSLEKFEGIIHTDFKMANLLIQGNQLIPIDEDDFRVGKTGMRVDKKKINEITEQLSLTWQELAVKFPQAIW